MTAIVRDETFDPSLRMSALVALAAPESPTAEAEQTLRELADRGDGLGSHAVLILGVMAHRLGGTRSRRIVEFIRARESCLSPELFHDPLGNAGKEP